MSTSEVHAAIQALYGQNAEQQKAANAFLVQFASTPAAWETALALLGVADPAVQYFGANMLYGKCKSDWATLPEAHREQFSEAVGAHLSRLANAPGSNLAARRLCLVMAAAATRAGPAHAFALVDRALALAAADGASAAPAGVTLALEMQAAIAEETNDAASAAERQALVDALVPRLTDVLGTAERVFEACRAKGSSSGEYGGDVRETGFESLRAAALHAALAWLKLDERGGGGIVLSPGQLASSRGGLLRGALACLGADDAATGDKATEFCVAALAYGAPPSPVPGEDESAVLGMIQALVTSGQTAVGNADQEDFARNICKVAVAVVERDASFAASASAPEACLALTSLVLSLAETHERGIMEACADYFLMLNTVSVAERHPGLRAPLFQRVLAACARHAAFPAGFTTWRDASEDRDAFHRFREQILVDVLDNCFGMCGIAENGGGYLGFVASQLDTIASWQQAESALFLARAASSAAKRLVVRTRAAERERETESETREREGTDAFLRQTLTRIGDASPGSNPVPNSAVFASHPLVVAAAARVIGAYAPWLGHVAGRGDEGGVAIKCAAYLLAALQAPEAFRHASGAFHALCAQCADAFARRDTVTTLLDAAERALPESPPSGEAGEGHAAGGGAFGGGGVDGDDDRAGVVEGLARVVAAVSDPREAASCAKRLTAPIMARAARHAEGAKATGELPNALSAELKLLASAVRFLEFPGFDAAARRLAENASASTSSSIEHPALAALQEAWPTLSVFNGEPWRSVPAVADATSAVYQKALLCAKDKSFAFAPHVLEALAATFAAHRHPSCLDALGTAAEACFSSLSNHEAASEGLDAVALRRHTLERLHAVFGEAFASCVDAAASTLSANAIEDAADVARALFECAHKLATFAPFVFLNATHGVDQRLACHTVLSVAVAALQTRERDAVRAATALLSMAAAPGDAASRSETWRAGRARSVDAFFVSASTGETVVSSALRAGADHAPRHVLRPLAQFLFVLRATYGGVVDERIAKTLGDASFPDANAPASAFARESFSVLATDRAVSLNDGVPRAPLDARRWAAACVDFFMICRRELGEDALVAHQM